MYFEFNSPHVPIKLVQTYVLLLTGFRWWPRVELIVSSMCQKRVCMEHSTLVTINSTKSVKMQPTCFEYHKMIQSNLVYWKKQGDCVNLSVSKSNRRVQFANILSFDREFEHLTKSFTTQNHILLLREKPAVYKKCSSLGSSN